MQHLFYQFSRLAFLLILVLLAACASGPKVTQESAASTELPAPTVEATATTPESSSIALTDGLGREVLLPGPAQRIVSLAPSNTEILFAIGADTQVVGRDSFSDYPPEAAQVKDIGGGFGELDRETILALQPDLVLASSLTPPEQVQALEELGLTVFALANPVNFDGLYINILTMATLTDRLEEAGELVNSLKLRVAAVEEKITKAESRPLIFYELDGTDPNAPWTSGPGTFVDTLIGMAGGLNLGSELIGDWVQISIEELIVQDPDMILLGSAHWGGVTPEAVAARSGWDALQAVQNNQVMTFDDNLVSRPGPRLVDGLEAMAKLIHPELFK